MKQLSAAAVERAMKLQDVMLRAMAELDIERNLESLRREITVLGSKYPVVTDNDYTTWKAYQVQAWPTLFMPDKQGRVRWTDVGEGAYAETEEVNKKTISRSRNQAARTQVTNFAIDHVRLLI